ncbi:hypothetical protein J6590_015421 [Homalodisca vitripennis]|nr:hypothetical protein J6590_015421 [Homalodisca vitripennis]
MGDSVANQRLVAMFECCQPLKQKVFQSGRHQLRRERLEGQIVSRCVTKGNPLGGPRQVACYHSHSVAVAAEVEVRRRDNLAALFTLSLAWQRPKPLVELQIHRYP